MRGRPLLPRGHADRRARPRPGRGARARRRDPLAPARRRLLPRRPARLDVDAARAARASRACACATACGSSRFVARCRTISDHEALDDEPIEPWTRRIGGRPRSGSASGGRCSTRSSTAATTTFPPPTCGRACAARPARATAPAARSWAGSRAATRRSSTRSASAIVAARRRAARSTPGALVSRAAGGARSGVVVDGGFEAARPRGLDAAAAAARRRCSRRSSTRRCRPTRCRYLGVVCVVARVRRSVSPYYALNITDRRVPLTSVVETTHVVDPGARRAATSLYVPRYVLPDSPGARAQSTRGHHAASTSATCRRDVPRLRPRATT